MPAAVTEREFTLFVPAVEEPDESVELFNQKSIAFEFTGVEEDACLVLIKCLKPPSFL